jgi:HSP20 family protein
VMGTMVGTATSPRSFEPAIDVRTKENEIVLLCDLPGVRREELDITLENHVLTIKGARRFEGRERERVMLGRAYGPFARAVTLPDSIDEAKLSAELADGVLTVRLPRHESAKPRKIPIGGGKPSPNALDEPK